MFLGLEWYWWLVVAIVVIVAIPIKVMFLKRWSASQRNKQQSRSKWGDDE